MPKLSYMQRREHRSTLRSQSEIYGPRVTWPILHWGFGLKLCKGRNECEGVGVGGGREAVCFDYFLLEGDDLRGGRGPVTSLT